MQEPSSSEPLGRRESPRQSLPCTLLHLLGGVPSESVPVVFFFLPPFRSWDEFHDCANVAMSGCPNEAAVVWESLRQESKKMQFSGNLYDMCSKREDHAAASVSPRGSLEINQESLKGRADHPADIAPLLVLLAPLLLLLC